MIAVDRVSRDLDAARRAWRQAQWVDVSGVDYRAVAREARVEAGATWSQRVRPRRHAKTRLDERRFAIHTEDALVAALVVRR
jgi:hypothetical protein